MKEDIFVVRRVGQFAGQILAGEMQVFVHLLAPARAVADIIDNAIVRNPLAAAALAIVAAQFLKRDETVGGIHCVNYTGLQDS